MTTQQQPRPETSRVIGRAGGFSIVAGSMLGIGIFLSPPIVAGHVASPSLFLLIWALGGLTALAGAVACAELATMMPRAGGDYVFQYEAFGPSVAFASGWVLFAAIFCGSIAAMTVALCRYQLSALAAIDLSAVVFWLPWTGDVTRAQLVALALIVALTVVNALGAQLSARTQNALTFIPIAVLGAGAVYAVGAGEVGAVAPLQTTHALPKPDAFVLAYMAVYFAYSGWINIIYVAGEVDRPSRNIPISLISGTVAITALYLLMCSGFLLVLGMEGLREVGEAGSATAAVLAGPAGETALAFLIACALLASINATVLGGARVAFAMAQTGAIWSWLGGVGPHRHVPHRALWLQAFLSCSLVLSGRFEELLSMVSVAMVITGSLTVASLFVLRKLRPDAERPYHATGYPFLPGIYLLSSVLVVTVMIARAFSPAPGAGRPLLGLAILVLAFVGHRIKVLQSSRTRHHAPNR